VIIKLNVVVVIEKMIVG